MPRPLLDVTDEIKRQSKRQKERERSKQVLEDQQAKFGSYTPHHIVTDIENLEKEISIIKDAIEALKKEKKGIQLFEQGKELWENRDFAGAILCLEEAKRLIPDDDDIINLLIHARQEQETHVRRKQEGIQLFEQGKKLCENRDFAGAILHLEEAKRLIPDDDDIINLLIHARQKQKRRWIFILIFGIFALLLLAITLVKTNSANPATAIRHRQAFPAETSSRLHSTTNEKDDVLVFSSNRSGNYEIYTYSPKTDVLKQITFTAESEYNPVWSRDGNQIAFVSTNSTGSDIFIMNADGSNVEQITASNGEEWSPSWSPNGDQLVYYTTRNGNSDIYMSTLATKKETPLIIQPKDGRDPTWSPNGNYIVYYSNRDGDDELYLYDVNTGQEQQLTTNNVDDYIPTWSPNGRRIAFTQGRDDSAEVMVLEVDSGIIQRITTNTTRDWFPTWVSNELVAFASGPYEQHDILVVNINKPRNINLLVGGPFDDWYPNGFFRQ